MGFSCVCEVQLGGCVYPGVGSLSRRAGSMREGGVSLQSGALGEEGNDWEHIQIT